MRTIGRGVAVAAAAGLLSLGFATTASAEPNADNPNNVEYWEAWLTEEGFENVECEKIHDEGLDTDTWVSDGDYLLVVLKAGSDQSTDDGENTVFGVDEDGNVEGVLEGDELSTESGKDISHIITCTGDMEEEPTPTPTRPTGPVVETDVPASDSSSMPVLLGGAAVLAGAGLVAGAMRRRGGQH
ncbi:hypothetical protein LL946_10150 [Knoellia locipacati]|uniref:hypothetical protein n=1 Tax=Knoellia locipacati TaxID=882824 RepID=UPI00384CD586